MVVAFSHVTLNPEPQTTWQGLGFRVDNVILEMLTVAHIIISPRYASLLGGSCALFSCLLLCLGALGCLGPDEFRVYRVWERARESQ